MELFNQVCMCHSAGNTGRGAFHKLSVTEFLRSVSYKGLGGRQGHISGIFIL